MQRVWISGAVLGLCVAGAAAQSSITLFGQEYTVQRFNYFDSISWTWDSQTVPLHSVEGVVWLGNDRLLLSTEEADQNGLLPTIPENAVVEVRIPRDPGTGLVTGLFFERLVLTQDETFYFLGGWGLNPSGITINSSANGLAAGGNLVVADTESDDGTFSALRGYNLTTGQQLPWPPDSNCLSINDGKFCEMSLEPHNLDVEDVVYVAATDRFYTVADNVYRVVTFTTSGTYLPDESFDIPLFGFGETKGIAFVPNNGKFPAAISDGIGTFLISQDDNGPALQARTLNGQFLAFEPLTTNGLPSGPPKLEVPDGGLLQIEALAVDPATGRIFLINQGQDDLLGDYLWVLTPVAPGVCPGDADCDGDVDFDDIDRFITRIGCPAGADCDGPCPWQAADVDQDGDVDFDDIDPLVTALGSTCP